MSFSGNEMLGKWLEFIEGNRDDRGMMACLRRALAENGQSEAWPWLARFCNLSDQYRADVFLTVGGLYASWPESTTGKDMGMLCRELCDGDERKSLASGVALSDDVKEGPMTGRFKQLIDSDRDEILPRVRRLVMMAKASEKRVDYAALGNDLLFWGEGVRRRWAMSFWGWHAGEGADAAAGDAE